MAWMYILECADGSYYVGSTRDIDRRLKQHSDGEGAAYTRRRLPVALVYAAEFESVDEAFWWEKRVQRWSRAKREALIRGDYAALPALAKKDWSRRKA
ncbi:GIY-YIG nuclease family protein [Mumia sp. DW29H23]|uniref:GIY-YIG nuclease family protein n=1 Tax=Mumia sp. DW29H23 TaxID=3421241 RepID=UPI003D684066